jgi:hypothetical protein
MPRSQGRRGGPVGGSKQADARRPVQTGGRTDAGSVCRTMIHRVNELKCTSTQAQQNMHDRLIAVLSLAVIIATSAFSTDTTSSSHSRRAFISGAFALPFIIPLPNPPSSNAYGEFEPGARARRRAVQQQKATAQQVHERGDGSTAPSQGVPKSATEGEQQTLTAALSEYSYARTQTESTKNKK